MYPPMDPREASRILSGVKNQDVREDDDLDLQPLDLQPIPADNAPRIPYLEDPIGDIGRTLGGLPSGVGHLALGMGKMLLQPPSTTAMEMGNTIAGQMATSETPGTELGANVAEQVLGLPINQARQVWNDPYSRETPRRIGEMIPAAALGIWGLHGMTRGMGRRPVRPTEEPPLGVTPDVKEATAILSDPNYNQGKGDAELAGSVPYRHKEVSSVVDKDLDLQPIEPTPTPEQPQTGFMSFDEIKALPKHKMVRESDAVDKFHENIEYIKSKNPELANQLLDSDATYVHVDEIAEQMRGSEAEFIGDSGAIINKATGEEVISPIKLKATEPDPNPELTQAIVTLDSLLKKVPGLREVIANLEPTVLEKRARKLKEGKYQEGQPDMIPEDDYSPAWIVDPRTGEMYREGSRRVEPSIGPAPVNVFPHFKGSRFNKDLSVEEAQNILAPKEEVGDADIQPQFMKVGENKAQISVNVKRAADELTSGYSSPLEGIMVREGLQNAFDIIKPMGVAGKARIHIGTDTISVSDNGRGMSRDELFTVYTNLHESGKTGEAGATGGKGVGKAPFMLGGKYFEVTTVKDIGGKKIESSFKGTPEELMQPFDIVSREVPPDTPTFTKFTTTLKDTQETYSARTMFEDIRRYSRDLDNDIEFDTNSGKGTIKVPSFKNDQLVTDEMIGNNGVGIYIPPEAKTGNRSSIQLIYLNNGMYQFKEHFYLSEEVNGIPDKVLINIKPKVEEGSPEYPFPVQRESVKETIGKEIERLVRDKVVTPMGNKKKVDLVKLWNSMPVVKTSNASGRDTVFFDPGDRLTKTEAKEFQNNIFTQYLTDRIDTIVNNILATSGHPSWKDKVVRVGITLDPNMYGVHIPNPSSPKAESAILINPFQHMLNKNPADAALDIVVTALHEAAHVGHEAGTYVPLKASDITDKRVGRFLQSYIEQTIHQGGLDMSHGFPFLHRLGELYAKYGTANALDAATKLEKSITGKGALAGSYSPEVQKLLRIYTDSRGRAAVTEDILSGTGTKQSTTGGGKGSIPSDDSTVRGGILKRFLSDESGSARGPNEPSTLREAWNLTRGILSTDLPYITSAALRQGKGHIGSANWWKAWLPSFKAYGSQVAFEAHNQVLRSKHIFDNTIQTSPEKIGKDGRLIPATYSSPIKLMGIRLIELNKGLGNREEAIRSELAEQIPVFGVFNKASNRQFAAYLNDLRVNAAEELYNYAAENKLYPNKNLPLLRQIGDYVNNSTGSGNLRVGIKAGWGREFSLEDHATALAEVFFSPRLTAANLHSFNPYNYFGTSPMVRKQYWKSAARMAGAWLTFASLAKLGGADVVLDPTSADFGKIKIGKTRIDPAGGLQQFMVLAARQGTGKFTYSTSGRTVEMGSNLLAPTRYSVAEEFTLNKLHPSARFLVDFARATKRQPFQGADRVLQASTPMIIQDLTEIINEGDPRMLLFTPLISAGWGTQTYDKGPREGLYIDKENDIPFQGGSFMPPD